ncbi:geranylgeranyl reductase [Streptomyces viridosporus ATCC 14672]|uniref:Geranylgeranyl reductase n=1 Tax=Streptomyces viridosporus (strain ATCC 14672 / DSM 40746 / JCM 4963 / KCTC 9882 / NRRL B-12104 / FH 1290) TaxID=566461 RepID=D5ZU73_STRV1|nr:geranylgeranyl reductase [Streptomyces viridosporus ATCC 14672]
MRWSAPDRPVPPPPWARCAPTRICASPSWTGRTSRGTRPAATGWPRMSSTSSTRSASPASSTTGFRSTASASAVAAWSPERVCLARRGCTALIPRCPDWSTRPSSPEPELLPPRRPRSADSHRRGDPGTGRSPPRSGRRRRRPLGHPTRARPTLRSDGPGAARLRPGRTRAARRAGHRVRHPAPAVVRLVLRPRRRPRERRIRRAPPRGPPGTDPCPTARAPRGAPARRHRERAALGRAPPAALDGALAPSDRPRTARGRRRLPGEPADRGGHPLRRGHRHRGWSRCRRGPA